MRAVELVSGGLLIAIGLFLIISSLQSIGGFSSLSGFFFELTNGFDAAIWAEEALGFSSASLSLPIAFIAGLLSFLSPCVLPLVPAYVGYLAGQAANDVSANVA
ncbi:MAG: hypothetical protein GYB64_19600, partial [Chloroflexi bacterium]|nr:hypothetical protein [Chloroflexota bacterium]